MSFEQSRIDAQLDAVLAASNARPLPDLSDDEVARELARYRSANRNRTGRAQIGVAGLVANYEPPDVFHAAHDWLREQVGRPTRNPHPGVAAYLRDASFADVVAAVATAYDGGGRLPADKLGAVRASLMTTDTLPTLIEQVATTAALAIVDEDMDRLGWTARVRLRDFKASAVVRAVGGSFVRPSEDGIIPTAAFELGAESIQVRHYVADWALTLESLTNAGSEAVRVLLEALTAAATRQLRRSAFELLESNPTLSDGVAMFHSDRVNTATGTSLSVGDLDAAIGKLANLATADDVDLDAMPAFLLVDSASHATARTLTEASFPELRVISSPAIAAGNWYVVPSPRIVPVVAFATLEESPFSVTLVGPDQDADLIRYRARLDYGFGPVSAFAVKCTS